MHHFALHQFDANAVARYSLYSIVRFTVEKPVFHAKTLSVFAISRKITNLREKSAAKHKNDTKLYEIFQFCFSTT